MSQVGSRYKDKGEFDSIEDIPDDYLITLYNPTKKEELTTDIITFREKLGKTKINSITADYTLQTSDCGNIVEADASNNNITITLPDDTNFSTKAKINVIRADCPLGNNQKEINLISLIQTDGVALAETSEPHHLDDTINKNLGIFGSSNGFDTVNTNNITVIDNTRFTYKVSDSLPATATGSISVIITYIVRIIGENSNFPLGENIQLDDFQNDIDVYMNTFNIWIPNTTKLRRDIAVQGLSQFFEDAVDSKPTLITQNAGSGSINTTRELVFGFIDRIHSAFSPQYRIYRIAATNNIDLPDTGTFNTAINSRGKFEITEGVFPINDDSMLISQIQKIGGFFATAEESSAVIPLTGNHGNTIADTITSIGAARDLNSPIGIEPVAGTLNLKTTKGILRVVAATSFAANSYSETLRRNVKIEIEEDIPVTLLLEGVRANGGLVIGLGFEINTLYYEDPGNPGNLLELLEGKGANRYIYYFYDVFAAFFYGQVEYTSSSIAFDAQESPDPSALASNGAAMVQISITKGETDLTSANTFFRNLDRLRNI